MHPFVWPLALPKIPTSHCLAEGLGLSSLTRAPWPGAWGFRPSPGPPGQGPGFSGKAHRCAPEVILVIKHGRNPRAASRTAPPPCARWPQSPSLKSSSDQVYPAGPRRRRSFPPRGGRTVSYVCPSRNGGACPENIRCASVGWTSAGTRGASVGAPRGQGAVRRASVRYAGGCCSKPC